MSLLADFRFALRSLSRVKGLAITVVATLALGIGANAAIFSVVSGVLLRPLVNRDEDRLIYIRQSAPGLGVDNSAFSVPEIQDLRARVKTLAAFGDFSTIGFTMVGLGEPRVVRAGVVGGSYFDVMGLRPVLGRLLGPSDDGPAAAGAAVLTHRFWTDVAQERSVGDRKGRQARHAVGNDCRRAGAVGAVPGGDGDHRQRSDEPAPPRRNDDGRTGPSDDRAVRTSGSGCGPRGRQGRAPRGSRRDSPGVPRGLLGKGRLPNQRDAAARSDQLARTNGAPDSAGRVGADLRHRLLERREPDPGAIGAPRRRARHPRGAWRRRRHVAPDAACRKPAALRCWRGPRCRHREADGGRAVAVCSPLLGPRARRHRGRDPALGGCRPGRGRSRAAGVRPAATLCRQHRADSAWRPRACASPPARIDGCARLPSRRSPRRLSSWQAPACC